MILRSYRSAFFRAFLRDLPSGNAHVVVWASANTVGGVPRPDARNDRAQRFLLNTLRFSLECFQGESGDFVTRNRSRMRAILIRPEAAAGQQIAFDDLQLE